MAQHLNRRERLMARLAALKTERQSYDAHWTELAQYMQPRRSNFVGKKTAPGKKRHGKIANNAALLARRTLSNGMQGNMTSRAHPWFKLATQIIKLNSVPAVKRWLEDTTTLIRTVLDRSNFYTAMKAVYDELAAFGTACMLVLDDIEDGINCHTLTIGQFWIATDNKRRVTTVYRVENFTVEQMVEEFGLEACSHNVREAYNKGQLDQTFEVLHVVTPNDERQLGSMEARDKKFASLWMEMAGDATTPMLRESGFDSMAFMVPRWSVTANEPYGNCPGMDALGDAISLQVIERRKASAVLRENEPPLVAGAGMEGYPISTVPNAINYTPDANAAQLKALYQTKPQIQFYLEDIKAHEERIKAAFYTDLFLMLTSDAAGNKTAYEVAALNNEKLQILEPVVGQLMDDLYDPLMERIFSILADAELLPEIPPELEGVPLKVEYTSVLADALKQAGLRGMQSMTSFVFMLSEKKSEALDLLDTDEIVRQAADAYGVSQKTILGEEEVKVIRVNRQRQVAQQQQMEAMPALHKGAQALNEASQADVEGLNDVARAMGAAA